MDIEIRPADDLAAFLGGMEASFSGAPPAEDVERFEPLLDLARTVAVYDGDHIVGTNASFAFSLSVPGGELPAAGVTMVGVHPTHRRRGLLRRITRAQIDDLHARGEPLAVLWASEGSIYQRFGYGLASRMVRTDLERDRAVFLDDTPQEGRTRLLDRDEAVKVLPDVYDRAFASLPGLFRRSRTWWSNHTLADTAERSEGGTLFRVVWEHDGRPEAYALYRVKQKWDVTSKSILDIVEMLAATPRGEREMWRFLFGVDLIDRVRARALPVDTGLYLLMAEPNRLRIQVSDGLWLRLIDVARALEGRGYASDGRLTLALSDEFCPWNEGTWQLEVADAPIVARTESAPDIRLGTRDLAAAYLGEFSFADLARAGRVEEIVPGSLARADALFAVPRAPFCPEIF